MCGGPTQQQKDAATQTAALDKQLAGQFATGSAVTNPFFSNLVTNPGQNPQLAQQYGMQKAQLAASDAGFGGALPSGFAAQQKMDLGENYAQTQDASMFGRQMAGAQGLNPLASAQTAQSGNNSILQAPLQNNFWSNLVGGLVGAIPGMGGIGGAISGAKHGADVQEDDTPIMAHEGEVILNRKQQKKYLKKKPTHLPKVENRSIYVPSYA
jgi:hypothetical protein